MVHEAQSTNSNHSFLLTVLILVGLVAGAVVGQGLFAFYHGEVPDNVLGVFDFIGSTCFINLLKMVLLPLVVSSVIVGVSSIGDPSKLGFIGITTVIYYLSTMVIAAFIGLVLVQVIQPGAGMDPRFRDQQVADFQATENAANERLETAKGTGLLGAARNIVEQMIPTNPIHAAAEGQMLPVISFCLLMGIAMTVVGDRGDPLKQFFESLFAAIMKLVEWILWLAPIGVFALLTWTVAKIGLTSLIGPLTRFVVTVLLGLTLHGMVVLPLVLYVFGRANPAEFFWQMRGAADGLGHGFVQRDVTGDDRMRRTVWRLQQTSGPLRVATGGNREHGWHGTLRSGHRRFSISGVRYPVGWYGAGDHCHHRDAGRDWRRRNSLRGPRYDGDRRRSGQFFLGR